jgi:thymidylate synthase
LLEGDPGELVLNMNAHWRSRDAYKAAFMNIFAFVQLQQRIAARISSQFLPRT